MATARGVNARVKMKYEAAYGTNPGGTDWRLMPFIPPLGYGAQETLQPDDALGLLLTSRDSGDPFSDTIDVAETFSPPVDTVLFGYWLALLFGLPATSGTGPYTHVFRSGSDTDLPSVAMEVDLADAVQRWLHLGLKANTLQLEAAPTGRPRASVGWIARSAARSGAAVDAAPTAPTDFRRFHNFEATLKREGAPLGRVESFSINYSNNMEADRSIGSGAGIEEATEGRGTNGGSMTVRLDTGSDALLDDADSGSPIELECLWSVSASLSLSLLLPRVFVPRQRATIQGPNGIRATFNFQSSAENVDSAHIVATLVNGHASYAAF
jgi:hypothetical protein